MMALRLPAFTENTISCAPFFLYDRGMTSLEKFFSFAQRLPADQREAVEEALAALMDSMSERFSFSARELAEIDRRAADPAPEFSDPDDIARIFGRPFSA
jgi:hypothetical protein